MTRNRYLYVRLLEACNAGCFMCGFAHSTDDFRFGLAEFEGLLTRAARADVKYVRFTGGEPLMHREILPMIRHGADSGMLMSTITNGHLLARMATDLASNGLSHVVVSLDGETAEAHNARRDLRGCFEHAIDGIRRIVELGVTARVNTVVGPHNYREMPQLQRLLDGLGVSQWELSALKLPDMPNYPNQADVLAVGDTVYAYPGLVPMGKRWYGDSDAEQHLYFHLGIPPRPSTAVCHAATDVIYIDAKNSMMFPCSCLPHGDGPGNGAAFDLSATDLPLVTKDFGERQTYFALNGPAVCTGCSSTAAGYSDEVERSGSLPAWTY
jgi:cytosylglucuronate decarboxylase